MDPYYYDEGFVLAGELGGRRPTRGGLGQAITRIARRAASRDRRTRLEALDGLLVHKGGCLRSHRCRGHAALVAFNDVQRLYARNRGRAGRYSLASLRPSSSGSWQPFGNRGDFRKRESPIGRAFAAHFNEERVGFEPTDALTRRQFSRLQP